VVFQSQTMSFRECHSTGRGCGGRFAFSTGRGRLAATMQEMTVAPKFLTAGFFTSFIMIVSLLTNGCQSTQRLPRLEAMEQKVDLERFMGDWHVIANIPTFIERGAHNAVETYALNDDGTIATTFRFNRGSFDGPVRTLNPKGFVHNTGTNAEWRMRFIWPFKAAYLIVYLDDDYETTIIGVPGRRYLWIMAREPVLPEERFQELVDVAVAAGHDAQKIQRVPQQPLDKRKVF